MVSAPRHQSLYSEFDAALDHFRRYNRISLRAITPNALRSERLIYLDGVGVLLSMVNRLMLRQSIPKPSQIRFWDRVCIPISRVVDRLTGYNLGKSIVGVWRLDEKIAAGGEVGVLAPGLNGRPHEWWARRRAGIMAGGVKRVLSRDDLGIFLQRWRGVKLGDFL